MAKTEREFHLEAGKNMVKARASTIFALQSTIDQVNRLKKIGDPYRWTKNGGVLMQTITQLTKQANQYESGIVLEFREAGQNAPKLIPVPKL